MKQYQQNWPAYNKAAMNEKNMSEELLLELLETIKEPLIDRRGPKGATNKEKIYSLFVYTYNGNSSRRTISDLKNATTREIITSTPHYNTLLNYLNNTPHELITRLIRLTAIPLKNVETTFSVDSSGFSTSQFIKWSDVRTERNNKRRKWKKCHIIVGNNTNIITNVTITKGERNDSPELPRLVKKTAETFNILEVSADKAYSSRKNHNVINEVGAIPYIPFKKHTTGKSRGSMIWTKMFNQFLQNNEEFLEHYHKRSNVETTFSMIKRKFGNSIRTKKEDSQITEILMKCLCHNLAVLVTESYEQGTKISLQNSPVGCGVA